MTITQYNKQWKYKSLTEPFIRGMRKYFQTIYLINIHYLYCPVFFFFFYWITQCHTDGRFHENWNGFNKNRKFSNGIIYPNLLHWSDIKHLTRILIIRCRIPTRITTNTQFRVKYTMLKPSCHDKKLMNLKRLFTDSVLRLFNGLSGYCYML